MIAMAASLLTHGKRHQHFACSRETHAGSGPDAELLTDQEMAGKKSVQGTMCLSSSPI